MDAIRRIVRAGYEWPLMKPSGWTGPAAVSETQHARSRRERWRATIEPRGTLTGPSAVTTLVAVAFWQPATDECFAE